MTILIAELGNNSFGDFNRAKELVRVAIECGADLVKGQAFKAKDISGSMPPGFYKQCEFTQEQLIELVELARSLGKDMFYSIFSSGFEDLRAMQNYHKISASQSIGLSQEKCDIFGYDQDNYFISSRYPLAVMFEKSTILFVTKYLEQEVDLSNIEIFKTWFKKVGYSDHTIGNRNCIEAFHMGCSVIEKHFTLKKEMSWAGYKFRDTIHGDNPIEFEKLATIIKGVRQ